jgi:hypothetical protein
MLFISYNAESAQRGNGKQYLKNLLKIIRVKQKLFKNTPIFIRFWNLRCFNCFVENECVTVWENGGRYVEASRDWKAAKPRCLKNLKIYNLPVIWRNNKKKKAWTSAATMEERYIMFNAKLKKENRNAIPFLENATCHAK